MKIEVFDRQKIVITPIFYLIMELDLENMKEIMKASEKEYPFEKRKKSFGLPGVLITATKDDELAGYIENGIGSDNKEDLYISSIQIIPQYRNTKVFEKLLEAAGKDLMGRDFERVVFNVQKTNVKAINIYRKFGFTFEERNDKPKSYKAITTKEKIILHAFKDKGLFIKEH